VIGCVNDAPAPVLEIVSGVEVTTEVSVVGKLPDAGKGLRAYAWTDDAAGAVIDETTDVSQLETVAAHSPQARQIPRRPQWEMALDFAERPDSPVRFAFSQRSLLIFHLFLQRFHCLREGLHCSRNASMSAAVAGLHLKPLAPRDELAAGAASCAETAANRENGQRE